MFALTVLPCWSTAVKVLSCSPPIEHPHPTHHQEKGIWPWELENSPLLWGVIRKRLGRNPLDFNSPGNLSLLLSLISSQNFPGERGGRGWEWWSMIWKYKWHVVWLLEDFLPVTAFLHIFFTTKEKERGKSPQAKQTLVPFQYPWEHSLSLCSSLPFRNSVCFDSLSHSLLQDS